MQYIKEEVFHFLEQSQYFYEKDFNFMKKGSDEPNIKAGEKLDYINYTFLFQEKNEQTVAVISIPVKNPYEDVKWKVVRINEDVKKPIYQSVNPEVNGLPVWFRNLILESKNIYENFVTLHRIFKPFESQLDS